MTDPAEQTTTSTSYTPLLNEALVAAALDLEGIPRDGHMDTGADQGKKRVRFDYPTAEGVLAAVRGPLAKHGVSFALVDSQLVSPGPCVRIWLRVAHVSGEAIVVSKTRPIDQGLPGNAYDGAETRAVKKLVKLLLMLPSVEDDDPEEQLNAGRQMGAVTTTPKTTQTTLRPPKGMPATGPRNTAGPAVKVTQPPADMAADFDAAQDRYVSERAERKATEAADPDGPTAAESPKVRSYAMAVLTRARDALAKAGLIEQERREFYVELLGQELTHGGKGIDVDKLTKAHVDFIKDETRKRLDSIKERAADPAGAAV